MDDFTLALPEHKRPKRAFNQKPARQQAQTVPENIKSHAPAPSLTPGGSLQPLREDVDRNERERSEYLKALNRIKSKRRTISQEFSR